MEVLDDFPLYYVVQGLTAVISKQRPNNVHTFVSVSLSTSVIWFDSKLVNAIDTGSAQMKCIPLDTP